MPSGCGGRARWRCGAAVTDLWSMRSSPRGSTGRGRRRSPSESEAEHRSRAARRAAARRRRDAVGSGPAGEIDGTSGSSSEGLGDWPAARMRRDEIPRARPASDGSLTSVNAASGNCRQIARSSAVMVSQPNLNIYRPGSVTRPAFCHVTLVTTDQPLGAEFSENLLSPRSAGRNRRIACRSV